MRPIRRQPHHQPRRQPRRQPLGAPLLQRLGAVAAGAALLAPAGALAAAASVTADPAAQKLHATGDWAKGGALLVRRGGFVRAGLEIADPAACAEPGLLLRDQATGVALRMPLLAPADGALVTRLDADALAIEAAQACAGGSLGRCGWSRDAADPGGTLFAATLQAGAFGPAVTLGDDGGLIAQASPTGKTAAADPAAGELHVRYVDLVRRAGTPYYAVVLARSFLPDATPVRAKLAVWLPEDMPIGAYQLQLACGGVDVGEALPLVVLFNPMALTTEEAATPAIAALSLSGRDAQQAGPIGVGFALSAPDADARDVALELLAGFPMAARRHPALVARIVAGVQTLGPLVRRAGTGHDAAAGFGAAATAAAVWQAVRAWNDATGHFDLWGEALGDVGDGSWPFVGAARLRLLHVVDDALGADQTKRAHGAIAVVPPGTLFPHELLLAASLAGAAEPGGKAKGQSGGTATLAHAGAIAALQQALALLGPGMNQLAKVAVGGGPYTYSDMTGNLKKAAVSSGGPYTYSDMTGSWKKAGPVGGSSYTYSDMTGYVARSGAVVVTHAPVDLGAVIAAGKGNVAVGGGWSWSDSAAGATKAMTGQWSFDAAAAAQAGVLPVHAPMVLNGAAELVDQWPGEAAFLGWKQGVRVGASGPAGEPAGPSAGVTFVAAAGIRVDAIEVCGGDGKASWCKTGAVADTGSVFAAYKRGGGQGVCGYGRCFCNGYVGEGMLRALGVPTRGVTNFGSAHETKRGDDALVTVPSGGGPVWWDLAGYLELLAATGGSKDAAAELARWHATAQKVHGASIWAFRAWTEAYVPGVAGSGSTWNALDAGVEPVATDKAHLLTGEAAVEILLEAASKPFAPPRELLHGRAAPKG